MQIELVMGVGSAVSNDAFNSTPGGYNPAAKQFLLNGITVDLAAERLIDSEGRDVELRPQAFAVLRHLIVNAGQLVSREELMTVVWKHAVVTDDSLVQAIGDIRRALGDEQHEAIHTIRGRGYFIPANLLNTPTVDMNDGSYSTQGSGNTRRYLPGSAHRFVVAVVCFSLALGLSVFLMLRTSSNPSSSISTVPIIAVMRLGEAGTASDANQFADDFSADLVAELARSHGLQVVASRASSECSNSVLTDALIGCELGANYLLRGRVVRGEDQLRVKLQIIEVENAAVVLSTSASSDATTIDEQRDRLVAEISAIVEAGLKHAEQRRVMRLRGDEIDAYALSTRVIARMHTFAPAQYPLARREAQEAMTLDPGHAPVYVNLAYLDFVDATAAITGMRTMKDLSAIEQMLRRGMVIDPEIPRAWQLMSLLRTAQDRPQEAYDAAMHAVRLAPHDPDSLMALGIAQALTGSTSEAVENLQRARQAFLVAPSYFQQHYAMTHWAAGDYTGAIDAADRCLIQTPEFVPCWVEKIVAQVDAGRVVEALASANTIWPEITQADVQQFMRGFSSAPPMLERRLAAATLVGIAGSME